VFPIFGGARSQSDLDPPYRTTGHKRPRPWFCRVGRGFASPTILLFSIFGGARSQSRPRPTLPDKATSVLLFCSFVALRAPPFCFQFLVGRGFVSPTILFSIFGGARSQSDLDPPYRQTDLDQPYFTNSSSSATRFFPSLARSEPGASEISTDHSSIACLAISGRCFS
jgi:hypothetical protein